MKKILLTTLLASTALLAVGCKKDQDKGPKPTALDQSSFTTKSSEGAVTIKWTVPEGANYQYIRVTYTNPDTKKVITHLASVYSDSIVMDGLLKRYGAIDFKLQPVTKTGVEGDVYSVSAEALAQPKVVRVLPDKDVKMVLANGENDLFVSHPESSEGAKAGLIDNNNATYYHENWRSPQDFPHYIVMKMPENLSAFKFYYKCRDNGNRNNPKTMNVWVSNEFNDATPEYNLTKYNAVKVKELSGLPDARAAEYTSSAIILDQPYKYIWFEITSERSNGKFVALAEMNVTKVGTEVFDPETGLTTTN